MKVKKSTLIISGLAWAALFLINATSTTAAITKLAIKSMEHNFGELSDVQKNSVKAIVKYNRLYNPKDNGVQLAYMLATAWHESRLRPVRETFAKTDAQARLNLAGKEYAQDINGRAYYGRGLVQLTWLENYEKFKKLLKKDLVNNPDLALETDTAAQILVYGMVNGLFTGKKLSDYITNASADYYNARRVVNHLDRAMTIQNYTVSITDYNDNLV